jgi:hypothetical protein
VLLFRAYPPPTNFKVIPSLKSTFTEEGETGKTNYKKRKVSKKSLSLFQNPIEVFIMKSNI